MIEKNKNYTIKELIDVFGKDWMSEANVKSPPILKNKPIINKFIDFEEETRNIYIKISNLIKEKNNKEVSVWASGSRVKGTWRTREESEARARTYNIKIKYSDYDFYTDANSIPTKEEFLSLVGVAVDFAGGEGHKVLIEK